MRSIVGTAAACTLWFIIGFYVGVLAMKERQQQQQQQPTPTNRPNMKHWINGKVA